MENKNEILLSDSDSNTATDEMVQQLENDPDVLKLKDQQAELMRLIADARVMKSYRAVRDDLFGIGKRRQVSKAENKKKKAKRRMAKKSKR